MKAGAPGWYGFSGLIDDASRFKSGKQVGCYLGLTPRQYQSGASNRQGRISGQGHKTLRALMVEVSWLGRRWNPRLKSVYERVHRGCRARRKIAIVACARCLFVWCWAMLRDGQPWEASSASAEGSNLGKPVHREPLQPTLSAVTHSLRSDGTSDGRQGPEPQGQSARVSKRQEAVAAFFRQ